MKATHTTTNSAARMTLTGLFAAMITLMTAYICHIPYGANGGYIHFGDALIYIAAVLLPRPYALAAAAIGGTSLAGGKGSMAGTVLGAFTLSALRIGLIVIGMDTFYQYIAIGLIILVATYIENLQTLVVRLVKKIFHKG